MSKRDDILRTLGATAGRPAFLAPLAGYSDLPFRRICAAEGASLTTTELVSAAGIRHAGLAKSRRYLEIDPEREKHVLIQLFGSVPEDFAEAVKAILADPVLSRCYGIDINMGCPVPKVVKSGAGSALMSAPALAEEITGTVAELIKPEGYVLGVKFRRGFKGEEETAPELAPRLARAGADILTMHARFREQYYSGKADWSAIRRVEEALCREGLRESVLFTANGDITDCESRDRCLAETGADAVAVGRAAMGKPWIFRLLKGGELPEPEEQAEIIRAHAEASIAFVGEQVACREFRKILAAYAGGRPLARQLRRLAGTIESAADIERWLQVFLYGPEEAGDEADFL